MNLRLALDESLDTAATDGRYIVFCPEFMERLTDEQIDFVNMHELMHVALDHISRGSCYDRRLFNVACDIVVNSSIMHEIGVERFFIDNSELMHFAPDGSEGHLHTAEEVYHMLLDNNDDKSDEGGTVDNHDRWGTLSAAEREELHGMVRETADMVRASCGNVPAGVQRSLGNIHKGSVDWRRVLADFICEDWTDYSFCHPDRRYDSDVLIPDLVPVDGSVKKILFMVDTSCSMSKKEITAAYSEICEAIEQFDGRLSGLIGFFDADVIPPVPFNSVSDVLSVSPKGGGGTSIRKVFDYVRNHMHTDPPSSIVIITDGCVDIPEESCAAGIPVLWLYTCGITLPKWGSGAYIKLSQ